MNGTTDLSTAWAISNQTVLHFDGTRDHVVHTRNHAWLEGGIVQGKRRSDLGKWEMSLRGSMVGLNFGPCFSMISAD